MMPNSNIPPFQRRVQANEVLAGMRNRNGGGHGSSSQPYHHDPSKISLMIKGQDGVPVCVKVKRDSPIRVALDLYCKNMFLDLKVLRFLIDDRDFDYRKTPAQLGVEDNDLIVALMPKDGG